MYRSEILYSWAKNAISDKEVWPVFVPSYNRPNASLIQRAFRESEFPMVLCIRREQQDLYDQYIQSGKPYMILDNVHDISETREQIVANIPDYMDNIFMFDDDITWLDYMIPSQTKNGKDSMRPSKTCYGMYPRGIDILKCWMALLRYDKNHDRIALSSVGYKPDSWSISNAGKENKYNSGNVIQCIHMNVMLMKSHNIHYRPMLEVGNEDYALQFDTMSKGLLTTVYKDLMYDCPAINSIPGGCENSHGLRAQERYSLYLEKQKIITKTILGLNMLQQKEQDLSL